MNHSIIAGKFVLQVESRELNCEPTNRQPAHTRAHAHKRTHKKVTWRDNWLFYLKCKVSVICIVLKFSIYEAACYINIVSRYLLLYKCDRRTTKWSLT